MKKFKGEINGQQFTDQVAFQKAYNELKESGFDGNLNVSYQVYEVEDSKEDKNKDLKHLRKLTEEEKLEKRAEEIEKNLTDDERDTLVDTIEVIRNLVQASAEYIQENVDSDSLYARSEGEMRKMLSAAIQKIRFAINHLSAESRFLLCYAIHSATEEMVDQINSELVYRQYEDAKEQEEINDSRKDLEDEIREAENELAEAQKHLDELQAEYNRLDEEYDSITARTQAAKVASGFFDDLMEAFSYN